MPASRHYVHGSSSSGVKARGTTTKGERDGLHPELQGLSEGPVFDLQGKGQGLGHVWQLHSLQRAGWQALRAAPVGRAQPVTLITGMLVLASLAIIIRLALTGRV